MHTHIILNLKVYPSNVYLDKPSLFIIIIIIIIIIYFLFVLFGISKESIFCTK